MTFHTKLRVLWTFLGILSALLVIGVNYKSGGLSGLLQLLTDTRALIVGERASDTARRDPPSRPSPPPSLPPPAVSVPQDPPPSPPPSLPPAAPIVSASQRIAIGEWVQGTWSTTEYEAQANILARIRASSRFISFRNSSAFDVASVGSGKVLVLNGRHSSETFDDIINVRPGLNRGSDIIAMTVRRGSQWTVAVNGRAWDRWFEEISGWAVINNGVAIGVRIGGKWTIAVNGIPWVQRFDAVHGYNIFANGSVVAEVTANGRRFVVLNGTEDTRLPAGRNVRVSGQGKIGWYAKNGDTTSVTVNYNSTWKSQFPDADSMVINSIDGTVAVRARSNEKVTAVVDDRFWSNWYESGNGGIGTCYSSIYLDIKRTALVTVVVNNRLWSLWFDELLSTGCERTGQLSFRVKKNGKMSVLREEKIVTEWYSDMRGWVINDDGTLLAVASANPDRSGTLVWRVEIVPLRP